MKTNRFAWMTAVALGGLMALVPLAPAQEKKDEPKPAPKAEKSDTKRRGAAITDRLRHVAEELKLTDEQKEKVKPIFHEEIEKLRALRDDSNASAQNRRGKMREILEATNAKIKPILTAEQLERWDKIKDEGMRKRRKQQ
jgi:Spy/CpxP family protein refolding chaperone